jgi:carbohydrate diacid regulator
MPKAVANYQPSGSHSATTQLVQTAETVIARITELLDAPVTIVDQEGVVIASTDPHLVGLLFDTAGSKRQPAYLRVPLHLNGQAGEVIVGEPLNGEVISPRLAQVLVELVINQTTVAWLGQGKQPEFKNRFIHDLLHGLLIDETAIMREARLLGLDFGPPRAVILIDAADYILKHPDNGVHTATDAEIQRRAQVVIGSIVDFLHLPNDTICAYIGAGEVVVLKASNTQSLANWAEHADASELPSPSWTNLNALKRAGAALLKRIQSDTGATLSIGLGRYHPGLQGLARSYQDARAALSLGRRFHGQNQVHCLDGLGLAAFVGVPDERTKIELSTYLLSPLNQNPELLQTLAAFFAQDCCPSATASQLSIHRNTLSHRLDKITALTGLDARRFDDAVQIRLALLLRDLQDT